MTTGTIEVVAWNVQGEIGISDSRMQAQLDFLREHAAGMDIIMFQSVNYKPQSGDEWGGQLGSLLEHFERAEQNYHHVHTADWAHELSESEVQPQQAINAPHNRCNLTISRWPIERTPLSLRSEGNWYPRKLTYYTTHFPEKLLVSEIDLSEADSLSRDSLDTWNVGIINGSNWHEEKIKMLETVYGRLYLQNKRTDQEVVLGGDFNAPKQEDRDSVTPHGSGTPEYTHYPFYGEPYYFGESTEETDEFTFTDRWQRAESNVFDSETGQWDMRDAYWIAEDSQKNASSEDHTHDIPGGARKRLDHVLVSDHFDVDQCDIWNGHGTAINGLDVSDHAPVVAELNYTE